MTVPYTFANNYGNIPLSELDDNFASCKAFADTAGLVTEAVQPAITSVGILTSLSVSGNIVGNVNASIYRGTTVSVTGNITGGNITGGNIITSGYVSAAGDITGGNVYATNIGVGGNVYSYGNLLSNSNVSAAGNVTGGNFITTGTSSRYIDVSVPAYANITATNTYSLSTTHSINILIANNTGYTATLNMPTSPQDGQICNFAISGNTVTLVKGTGTVLPTFAGSTTAGTGYRYVYRLSNTSWYRIG